jgi:hypothetical protein
MLERSLHCVEVHGKNHFLGNAQFFTFTIIRHKARQRKKLRFLSPKMSFLDRVHFLEKK